MKTKKVNRYYCDYCKKANCSSAGMKKHELHCTMNPERICRMCRIVGSQQVPMTKLLKILPEGSPDNFCLEVEQALPKLRAATNGCPACMLAALRQAHINLLFYDFNYGVEMEEAMRKYKQS